MYCRWLTQMRSIYFHFSPFQQFPWWWRFLSAHIKLVGLGVVLFYIIAGCCLDFICSPAFKAANEMIQKNINWISKCYSSDVYWVLVTKRLRCNNETDIYLGCYCVPIFCVSFAGTVSWYQAPWRWCMSEAATCATAARARRIPT